MKVKKLHHKAQTPQKAHPTDAGFDLTCTTVKYTDKFIEYGTGLAVQLPENTVGLLFPRSSVTNKDLILGNCVGVLDQNYTGEIKFRYKKIPQSNGSANIYQEGDRIGQLVVLSLPSVSISIVDDLEKTDRGDGGYGSTGN